MCGGRDDGRRLWRYRLGDRVRCEGLVGRTPSVRFVGRGDLVVDRFGEKLSEGFVGRVIRSWLAEMSGTARFAMLAPNSGVPSHYTLFLELSSPDALPAAAAERLDAALCDNPQYAYCRRLGQLSPARVFLVGTDAYAVYVKRRQSLGQRMGDVKPAALDGAEGWETVFREGRHDSQAKI